MILTRTPLRVSLFGGGTDYPEWFNEHGGAVLGMAINKYVYVGVKYMPPGQELAPGVPLRWRVQYSRVDDCNAVDEIKHPVVRAALKHLRLDDLALEFHIFGDLPGRSGLGGSGAFTVGLLNALYHLVPDRAALSHEGQPLPVTTKRLAKDAIYLEQQVIKEAVGCQDQIFAASGGLHFIAFPRHADWFSEELRLSTERLTELEQSLALVYTGAMRDAHEMAARQIREFDKHQDELFQLKHLAATTKHALLNERASLSFLGPLLNETWRLKRSLCSGLTTPNIDALHEHGLRCGATGGKLLGAGGGGFMLFCVPPQRRAEFVKGIGAPTVYFKVEQEGSCCIIKE